MNPLAPCLDPVAEAQLQAFLGSADLWQPGESLRFTALTGGVSSDIWRADIGDRSVVVKRALASLRVSAEWRAPLSRNENEWNWLSFAYARQPQSVPKPLAHDPALGLFAMEYLPSEQYPVWKEQLMRGFVDSNVASQVGALLVQLHNDSADDSSIRRQFDTLPTFFALRLEPYFLATAERHSALSRPLHLLVEQTSVIQQALVHGDVSPKNILVGTAGPVLLDAECAWYGDPAFDLAFCLTHLLLKSLLAPRRIDEWLACFQAMVDAYCGRVRFDQSSRVESRAASLLPALLLSRIDGKSPVEYLVGNAAAKEFVRDFATPLILSSPVRLDRVSTQWRESLARSEVSGDCDGR